MSVAYTNRVWKQKQLKGGKLLVMLALAGHADDTGECWPGMALLMEKTRLTDRQLRRVLNELVSLNLITIEERAIGRGKKPHYKLFPTEKADIMTEEKRTLLPPLEIKADISDNKSGHFEQGKADISDADQSYVRREPIPEPKEETEEIAADAAPAPQVAPVATVSEKPVKPKRKRAATPKEPAAPKHPALVAYRAEFERWPNEKQECAVVSVVTDLDLWRLVLEKWNLRGYSRVNFDGMLDWYKHPEKFASRNGASNGTTNGHNSAGYRRPETAKFSQAEWDAYLADPEREASPF